MTMAVPNEAEEARKAQDADFRLLLQLVAYQDSLKADPNWTLEQTVDNQWFAVRDVRGRKHMLPLKNSALEALKQVQEWNRAQQQNNAELLRIGNFDCGTFDTPPPHRKDRKQMSAVTIPRTGKPHKDDPGEMGATGLRGSKTGSKLFPLTMEDIAAVNESRRKRSQPPITTETPMPEYDPAKCKAEIEQKVHEHFYSGMLGESYDKKVVKQESGLADLPEESPSASPGSQFYVLPTKPYEHNAMYDGTGKRIPPHTDPETCDPPRTSGGEPTQKENDQS